MKEAVDQLMVDVREVADKAKAVREKIEKSHVSSDGDCFFKANLAKYMKCVPEVKIDELQKLLDKDIEICQDVPKFVDGNLELVQKNYEKFMTQQKELLAAFINKQQKTMYGLAWEPVVSKLGIFEKRKEGQQDPPEHGHKEWPKEDIVEKWPLEKKIKLRKIHFKMLHAHC